MAYVQDSQSTDPNDQDQQGGGPATSSGGGEGGGDLGGASPQGAVSTPTATKAPPIQNLSAYLKANQPQALQQGQNIADSLTQNFNDVSGQINSNQDAFNSSVQAGGVAPDQALVTRAAQDPSKFVQNSGDVKAFKAQKDANYSGPEAFESSPFYQDLNQSVENAVSNAPDINKPGGVQQLVRGQEKNPTTGKANLDTLLLQETPEAFAPINAAIKPFSTLKDALTNAANSSNANVLKTKQDTQTAGQLVPDAFFTGQNASVPAWGQSLRDELTKDQQGATAYNDKLSSYIGSLNSLQPFSSAIDNSNIRKIIGMGDPFQEAPDALVNAPTQANTATQADYDKNAALEQLLGSSYSPELDDANAGQASKFSTPGSVPDTPDIDAILSQISNGVFNTAGFKGAPGTSPTSKSYTASGAPNTPVFQAYQNLLKRLSSIYPGKVGTQTHLGGVIGGGGPAVQEYYLK